MLMTTLTLTAWLAFAGQQAPAAPADSRPSRPPEPAAKPLVGPEYVLVPGDKLRIEVYKDAQLSQSLQVRPDGKITLPLVGDVPAAGLTPLALKDRLTESLKQYYTSPVVTVIVTEPGTAIYVMGEVAQPGGKPLTGPLTVLQALSLAGGFKDFANTKDIRILRPGPKGMQTLRFNYKDAVDGIGAPIYLQPGDTVVVR